MDIVERSTCPVCKSSKTIDAREEKPVGLIFGDKVTGLHGSALSDSDPSMSKKMGDVDLFTPLLQCMVCGHMWPQKYPTQDEMIRMYSSQDHWGAFQKEVSSSYRYQFGRARNAVKFLKWQLPQVGAALDVGCGKGALMNRLRKTYKCAVYGTEFSPEGDLAATIGPVARGTESMTGTVDLITMVQVLEHVLEPVPFLKETLRLLHPLGSIYIEVPNQRPITATAWHAHYFNQLSLRATLYEVGLFERAYWETSWPSPFSPPRMFPRSIGILCQKWDTWERLAQEAGREITTTRRYDEVHGKDRTMPWDRK